MPTSHSGRDQQLVSANLQSAICNLQSKTALLLIAHGSREEDANADLRHLVEHLRARRQYHAVEACFLELAGPNIDEGCQRCLERSPRRVVLLPYFLSAGVHVRRDLSAARARLAQRFPQVEFRLAQPLGRHPLLLEVVAQRAQEAFAEQQNDEPPAREQP